MYHVRAQEIRKHTSRIEHASPTAISQSPPPLSPLSFLLSFSLIQLPVAFDNTGDPQHRCKITYLAQVPATYVAQCHNTRYIASHAHDITPTRTDLYAPQHLSADGLPESRKSKKPRPKKPCPLLQCGTFTAWLLVLVGTLTHSLAHHTVKTGIIVIENDARKSKISSFGLRGKSMGKRILFQPSVETIKKKSAKKLTRRGNSKVQAGFSIVPVLGYT